MRGDVRAPGTCKALDSILSMRDRDRERQKKKQREAETDRQPQTERQRGDGGRRGEKLGELGRKRKMRGPPAAAAQHLQRHCPRKKFISHMVTLLPVTTSSTSHVPQCVSLAHPSLSPHYLKPPLQ